MKLCLKDLANKKDWENAGIRLPEFDVEKMKTATKTGCTWIHFGAGNIFRGFQAARMQDLIEKGICNTGIVVGEGFDYITPDFIKPAMPYLSGSQWIGTLRGKGLPGSETNDGFGSSEQSQYLNEMFDLATSKAPIAGQALKGLKWGKGVARNIKNRNQHAYATIVSPVLISSFAEGDFIEKTALRRFFLGGGRWIRTTEVTDNRFTVCPLWPLGNSPIFTWSW